MTTKSHNPFLRSLLMTVAAIGLLLLSPPLTFGQSTEEVPDDLQGVGLQEHQDSPLPLDATFTDSQGRKVKLGDYCDGKRPVILLPMYFSCPMLCGLTSKGLREAAAELEWTPGREYRIVVFSFDPREGPDLAKAKKKNTLAAFPKEVVDDGYEFLTGDDVQIHRLTDALGFNYRWNEKQKQFAHMSTIVICTPDGKISQYMKGVIYDPKTLRLLLVDASSGKIGSPLDQFALLCFHYDPEEGSYAWAASRLMRLGGILTVIVLAAFIFPLWLRGNAKRKRLAMDKNDDTHKPATPA